MCIIQASDKAYGSAYKTELIPADTLAQRVPTAPLVRVAGLARKALHAYIIVKFLQKYDAINCPEKLVRHRKQRLPERIFTT